MDIQALRKTIFKLPKLNAIQCDYFELVDRVQIVFRLPQSSIRQVAGYKDAEKRIRAILKACKIAKLDCDLRLGVKIHNGATVLTASFSKEVIADYEDDQDLQGLSYDWNKASQFV